MRKVLAENKSIKVFPYGSALISLLIVLFYVTFTSAALFNYPLAYSPTTHWLSDLGNRGLNPSGALFYNAGILLTALWLVLFFLRFSTILIVNNKIQNGMIRTTQVFGILGSLSMALSAFYPISSPAVHSFWSAALYINLGTAFAFSVAALRYFASVPKWLLAVGVLAALTDMLTSIFFPTVFIFEWITVSLFLAYVALLGVEVDRLGKGKRFLDVR